MQILSHLMLDMGDRSGTLDEVSKCRCISSCSTQWISKRAFVECRRAVQLTGHEKWESMYLNADLCMQTLQSMEPRERFRSAKRTLGALYCCLNKISALWDNLQTEAT